MKRYDLSICPSYPTVSPESGAGELFLTDSQMIAQFVNLSQQDCILILTLDNEVLQPLGHLQLTLCHLLQPQAELRQLLCMLVKSQIVNMVIKQFHHCCISLMS
jgi:hypothetical protein